MAASAPNKKAPVQQSLLKCMNLKVKMECKDEAASAEEQGHSADESGGKASQWVAQKTDGLFKDKSELNKFNYRLNRAPQDLQKTWSELKGSNCEAARAYVSSMLSVVKNNYEAVNQLTTSSTIDTVH